MHRASLAEQAGMIASAALARAGASCWTDGRAGDKSR